LGEIGEGLLVGSLGILFLTAWPEELLFRGLLQNFLERASKSEFAGWWTASIAVWAFRILRIWDFRIGGT